MSWALSGTYFENCTCEGACPCTASSFQWPADKDFCDVMFAFHVDSGEIDGTAVEDRSVVLLVHIPQARATDGNWKLGLYVDERASAEQTEKLGAVFGGQLGGPVAALAPLVGEVAGVERAPISFADDGLNHRVTVGDAIDTEVEDLTPPGSSEPTRYENIEHLAGPSVTVARATGSRVSGFGIEFEGKAGSSAPFAWSGGG
jgi:hypothetical protein